MFGDKGGEVNGCRRSLRLLSSQMFGNWTFGTLVFTVMVLTVTLKVRHSSEHMPVIASLPTALLQLLESSIHAGTDTAMLGSLSCLLQFISQQVNAV